MARWTARTRFRIEAVAALFTGVLAVVTAIVPDWIEVLSGVDPDHGNGSLEVTIVVCCAVLGVVSSALAWISYRTPTPAERTPYLTSHDHEWILNAFSASNPLMIMKSERASGNHGFMHDSWIQQDSVGCGCLGHGRENDEQCRNAADAAVHGAATLLDGAAPVVLGRPRRTSLTPAAPEPPAQLRLLPTTHCERRNSSWSLD